MASSVGAPGAADGENGSLFLGGVDQGGGPLTVAVTFRFDDDFDTGSVNDVFGMSLAADEAGTESIFALDWAKTTVGWFPMMGWLVTSDVGLFPPEVALSVPVSGGPFYELAVAQPQAGREYEAAMSFDPGTGWLSIAVNDLMTGARIGALEYNMAPYDGAMYVVVEPGGLSNMTVVSVVATEGYVPVGRQWVFTERANGGWVVPYGHRLDRDRAVAISMDGPALAGRGDIELTLQSADKPVGVWSFPGEAADDGTMVVPARSLPPGRYRAGLTYLDADGGSWFLGGQDVDIVIGHVDVAVGPFRLEGDTVTGDLALVADRPLDAVPFRLEVTVGADDEKRVWIDDRQMALSPEGDVLHYRFPNPGTDRYVPINVDVIFDASVVSRVEGGDGRDVMTVAWKQRMDEIIREAHPRLFATPTNIDLFRAYADDPWWQSMLKPEADALLKQPLPKEPPMGPASQVNTAEGAARWRAAYRGAAEAGSAAQTLAFAYVVTGDKTYAHRAKEIAMEMVTWDARSGSTSLGNDEAFIRVIHFLPFVYTWIHDTLDDDERAVLEGAIALRGGLLYDHLTRRLNLTDRVLDSHPIRFVPTLGLVGLALYHELDDAKEWVAWASAYYDALFPPWGGDAGGWSEGLGYWVSGILTHVEFLDALMEIGLPDLYAMPFFRHTGYFGRYMLTPHLTGSFGDLSSGKIALSTNVLWLMNRLAHVYDDAHLLMRPVREVNAMKTNYSSAVYPTHVHAVLHQQGALEPGSPADLPSARLFDDIGWVAMHSELGHADDNIMLTFKSSPYGSASHSHADQNSFILDAFGEPLFLNAGYREWHGSAHHTQWTQQTVSKNALLVSGVGQVAQSEDHGGEITEFFAGDRMILASGQAAPAYGGRLSSWLRTIAFVDKSYFVIHDDVVGNRDHTYEWLLHADHEMQLDHDISRMTVEGKKAGAFAQIVQPAPNALQLVQTNESVPPVDPEYEARFPNQWHVRAGTVEPSRGQNFVTVVYPYRLEGADLPDIQSWPVEPDGAGTALTVKLADRTDVVVVGWSDEGDASPLQGEGVEMTGRLAVVTHGENASGFSRWFLHGHRLSLEERVLWEAEASGHIEAYQSTDEWRVNAQMDAAGAVQLFVGTEPAAVIVDGEPLVEGAWRYDDGLLNMLMPAGDSAITVRFSR